MKYPWFEEPKSLGGGVYNAPTRESALINGTAVAFATTLTLSVQVATIGSVLAGIAALGATHLAYVRSHSDLDDPLTMRPGWKRRGAGLIILALWTVVAVSAGAFFLPATKTLEPTWPAHFLAAVTVSVVAMITLSALALGTGVQDNSTRLIAVSFSAVSVMAALAIVLLDGLPNLVIHGWVTGVIGGFLTIGPTTTLLRKDSSASRSTSRRFEQAVLIACYPALVVLASVTGLASQSSAAWWQPLLGWAYGTVFALLPAVLLSPLTHLPALDLVLRLTGEPPSPWGRQFRRFAVDRGLLIEAEGEFRFIHVLVRNYLANCDLAALTQAISRRRLELERGE